jgi:hypothetical protein
MIRYGPNNGVMNENGMLFNYVIDAGANAVLLIDKTDQVTGWGRAREQNLGH